MFIIGCGDVGGGVNETPQEQSQFKTGFDQCAFKEFHRLSTRLLLDNERSSERCGEISN